ncbi:MAG: EamA family transporter [Candidatus Glassbacteria bacterium]|nr:EamA family transporter [Candidatus Glassbacteria bacterium]
MPLYLAYLALAGRVLLTGYERIIFKQVGTGSGSAESVFLIFTTGTLLLAPVGFFVEWPADWSFLWIAALASLTYTVQTVFYVKSLSHGEASLVAPLYYFSVFFLLVMAVVFLGESFGPAKIAGLVLLVYGASFLHRKQSILHSLQALATDRACQFMIVSSVLVALGRTLDGFMMRSVHPLVYTLALCFFTDVFIFIWLAITGRLGSALEMFRSKLKVGALAGAVDCYSYLLLLIAITRIEVSVAEPASMLGMVVTVILAHFIFGERIKRRLVGVVVMFFGAWLLFV